MCAYHQSVNHWFIPSLFPCSSSTLSLIPRLSAPPTSSHNPGNTTRQSCFVFKNICATIIWITDCDMAQAIKAKAYSYLFAESPWPLSWACSFRWDSSHLRNPGMGDKVTKFLSLSGNSCCNSCTTLLIRKLPSSTPERPTTTVGWCVSFMWHHMQVTWAGKLDPNECHHDNV